jgi:F-type H+-transporting ATPase subunit b
MEDTLRQIGELLFNSIPTILAFLIVWTAYRLIVHPRLQQVLAERHTRTEGAMEEARDEIAAAAARTAECEERIRQARAEIYKAQESRRRQMLEERNAALTLARQQADVMIADARTVLEKDVATAKAALETQAAALAEQIIVSVLKPAAAVGGQ